MKLPFGAGYTKEKWELYEGCFEDCYLLMLVTL